MRKMISITKKHLTAPAVAAVFVTFYLPISVQADTTPSPAPTPQVNLFSTLANEGFSLHQTVDGSGATQGASFAYDRSNHNVSSLTTQFAISWQNKDTEKSQISKPEWFFLADFDGNLASGTTQKNSYYNIRPQFDILIPFEGPCSNFFSNAGNCLASSTDLSVHVGPVWEASQDGHIENMLFEVDTEPTYQNWSLGHDQNIPYGLSERTIFNLDLEAGSNITGRAKTLERDPLRLRVIPHPAIQIESPQNDGITKLLNLQTVVLSLDDTPYFLPLEGHTYGVGKKAVKTKAIYNLLKASMDFNLTENVSLTPSYTTGESAPSFSHADTFMLTLTVKFGNYDSFGT